MQARLLLSRQRSGSHFLKSFIESRFPGVVCSGEVLEKPVETQSPVLPRHPEIPRFWTWYAREALSGGISTSPDQRIAAFDFYLTTLAWKNKPNDLVIDVKYNAIRSLSGYEDTDHGSTDFTTFIKDKEIPVLHLIRKNILKTIVSNRLALHTGIWHRTSEKADSEILPKIRIGPEDLLRAITATDQLTADYQDHFRDHPAYEELVYEDLVRELKIPRGGLGLQTLARFFQKSPQAADPSAIWCKKTTPDDPAEVVENWEEIVRSLRNTKFGWMTETALLAAA
jgi:hypothetical protein